MLFRIHFISGTGSTQGSLFMEIFRVIEFRRNGITQVSGS